MDRRITHILVLIVLGAAMAACSSTRRTSVATETATKERPYSVRSEGSVPASERLEPEADVEESAVEEMPIEVDEGKVRIDSTRVPPPTLDGFRVQLFASIDKDAAENARREAERRLGVPVYVQFLDRMFKVRVGDCATREEAETLQARCRAADYPDAWIVASPVTPQTQSGQ